MLKAIHLQNLGSFDNSVDYTVNLNKETVFVGPNNAGKSQFFIALNMIRKLFFDGHISYNNEFYNINSFEQAVYRHELGRPITIQLDFDEDNKQLRYNFEIQSNNHFRFRFYEGDNLKEESTGRGLGNYPEHRELMSKIWYFSPVRSQHPHATQIGSYAKDMQGLPPSGSTVIQYLLERFNDRDPRWTDAEYWLRKIDPDMTILKTPLEGNVTRSETVRKYGNDETSINIGLQGTGMQNAVTIIAALIFSPDGTTICIEEPESHLHARSQEVLVDLFNHAVTKLNKQVVFSTHSWDMLLPLISDIGEGIERGQEHVKAIKNNFSLISFNPGIGSNRIQTFDISNKKFTDVRNYFKKLWG